MPRKAKNIRPKTRVKKSAKVLAYQRAQQGAGLFDSIKRGVISALKFAKQHKLISRGANALSAVGVPYVGTVGKVAGTLGYGRKRTTTKRKTGKGLLRAGEKVKRQTGTGHKRLTKKTVFP